MSAAPDPTAGLSPRDRTLANALAARGSVVTAPSGQCAAAPMKRSATKKWKLAGAQTLAAARPELASNGAETPQAVFQQAKRASIVKVWKRRYSKEWENRIPSERTFLLAAYELLVSGQWLQAAIKYDDYPGDTENDCEEFKNAQTHIGLLSALMLTIMVTFLTSYSVFTAIIPAILTFLIWTSTLLYFFSMTWSIINMMALGQADTDV